MRIFTLLLAMFMFSHTWLKAQNSQPEEDPGSINTACGFANAQTNSTTAVCVLCSVQNAANTTDADLNNFSLLSVPLAAGSGSVQQSMIFPTASAAGTRVRITLGLPAQVIDDNLLSAIEVSSYNGAVFNNDALLANSDQLEIIRIEGSHKFLLTFSPGATFDRVQIKLRSGVVAALVRLEIYHARIYVAAPVIPSAPSQACPSSQINLTATTEAGYGVRWYREKADGPDEFLGSGTSINVPGAPGSQTYYARSFILSNDCVISAKAFVNINIYDAPEITQEPVSVQKQVNETASFTIGTANTSELSYRWQADQGTGFTDLSDNAVYENTNTATLGITAAATSMSGYQYRCIISRCNINDTSQAATLTVNKIVQTISFTGQTNGASVTATYGDASITGTASSSASLTPVYQSSATSVATVDASGIISIVGAGTAIITASQPGNATYEAAAEISFTIAVSKKELDVQADPISKVFGAADPALTFSATGFVNNEDESILTGELKRADGESVNTYPIAQHTLNAGPNYSINYTGNNFTITKAPQTLSFVIQTNGATVNATYGDAAISAAANATSTLTALYQSSNPAVANVSTTGQVSITGSGTTVVTASQPGNASYEPATSISFTVRVSPKTLEITANAASKVFGTADPALTFEADGFVNGDDASILTGALKRAEGESVNTYPININTLDAGANYTIDYTGALFTITKATQTLSFAVQTNGGTVNATYGDAAITGTASSSATLTPVYQSSNPAIATVNASGIVSIVGAGTATITATQPGNASYEAAQQISFTVLVNPKQLTITANPAGKVYGTNDPALTYSVSGLTAGDNESIITGSPGRAAGENVNTYAIEQNTLAAGNNYTISFTGNTFTITKAPQTITWVQELESGCNNANAITLTASASSGLPVIFSVADVSVGSVTANTLTPGRAGSTTITADQPGDNNYQPATPVTLNYNNLTPSMIRQHWSNVLFFDNSSDQYVGWRWFKNGTEVNGQTRPYYSESQALEGTYYAIATDRAGNTLRTCPLTVSAGAAPVRNIQAYPNPAKAGTPITIAINYPVAELQGARLVITQITGTVMQQISNVQPTMSITLPSSGALFIVSLHLSNGQKASVSVLSN